MGQKPDVGRVPYPSPDSQVPNLESLTSAQGLQSILGLIDL